jgi:hypothetical protein
MCIESRKEKGKIPMVCGFCLFEDSSQSPLCHVRISEKAFIKLTQKMYAFTLIHDSMFSDKNRGGRERNIPNYSEF